MSDVKKICPFCGAEMALRHEGFLTLREKKYTTEDYMIAELHICPACRYLAWFAPLTLSEKLEQEKATQEAITDPVEKFMYLFRDYPAKKLQKVIDGRDYLPEAKEAARRLLRSRES